MRVIVNEQRYVPLKCLPERPVHTFLILHPVENLPNGWGEGRQDGL